MPASLAKTYTESLQDIVELYRTAGQRWPATSKEIARWAYREGHYLPQEQGIVAQLARELSRAMREECYTDPQGRRVRTKHAARRFGEELAVEGDEAKSQKMFWADIRTDDPDHIILALQQRRQQIVGDCKQLKTDADSFNENHPSEKQVQIVFNFMEDLEELDQPTEYRPATLPSQNTVS